MRIDGAYLLGSGQTVRLATLLSTIRQKPITIYNVRKDRDNPGLKEHHAKVIQTFAEITGGKCTGVYTGSDEFTYIPGKINAGKYRVHIEGCGNVICVLNSLILPLLFTHKKSEIDIVGGSTFPYIHFENTVLWYLRMMGIDVKMKIKRIDLAPGKSSWITATIVPSQHLKPLRLLQRGFPKEIEVHYVGPKQYIEAEYQLPSGYIINKHIDPKLVRDSFTFIARYDHVVLGSDGVIGCDRDETSYTAICEDFNFLLNSNATMDVKCAEHILPYLAFVPDSEIFTTQISEHIETAIWLCNYMLGPVLTYKKQGYIYHISSTISNDKSYGPWCLGTTRGSLGSHLKY